MYVYNHVHMKVFMLFVAFWLFCFCGPDCT